MKLDFFLNLNLAGAFIVTPFDFQNLGAVEHRDSSCPAHVFIVRCAELTVRLPTPSHRAKSFEDRVKISLAIPLHTSRIRRFH